MVSKVTSTGAGVAVDVGHFVGVGRRVAGGVNVGGIMVGVAVGV